LKDKQQISKVGIDEFRQHCQAQTTVDNEEWTEGRFQKFLKEIILQDPMLSDCFSFTYPVFENFSRTQPEYSPESIYSFHSTMNGLWSSYWPYPHVLSIHFDIVNLACQKRFAGDDRDFGEILSESAPKEYELKGYKTTTYYRVYRQIPVRPDWVLRNIKDESGEEPKWMVWGHYFDVDAQDKQQIENLMRDFLRIHCHEYWTQYKSSRKVRVAFHLEPLTEDIELKELDLLCRDKGGFPLHLLEMFERMLNSMVRKASKKLNEQSRMQFVLEERQDIENVVTFHLLSSWFSLPEQIAPEAITEYLEKSFKRKVYEWIGTQPGEQPFIKLEEPTTDEKGEEVGTIGETISGGMIPLMEKPELDEIFTDPVENYLAKNYNKKGAVKKAAKKFGKSIRRIQQVKKKVGEDLDELCEERLAHLCGWFPGIDDSDMVRGELRRIASLRYKKLYPKHPPKHTRGRVKKREKRQTELTKKYKDLEGRLKKD
jgi:hypothetical protein